MSNSRACTGEKLWRFERKGENRTRSTGSGDCSSWEKLCCRGNRLSVINQVDYLQCCFWIRGTVPVRSCTDQLATMASQFDIMIYVTLDHKTSHKGTFFEIEMYTSSEHTSAFHWCMVCYDRTIFVWDTTIWESGIWGCKKIKNIEKITFKIVQMKFLAMNITNQKLSVDIFMVRNLQNIFMEHDLYLIS